MSDLLLIAKILGIVLGFIAALSVYALRDMLADIARDAWQILRWQLDQFRREHIIDDEPEDA